MSLSRRRASRGIRPRQTSLLIGRASPSRGIHPDIDCEPDAAASRPQARLTGDGDRWWLEDLGSANGTFLRSGGGPLSRDPLPVHARQERQPPDRIYVGASIHIAIRPAAAQEPA